ncbi:hypothetical protein BH11MYX2_BH11MYX2_04590 [soil metagenome]
MLLVGGIAGGLCTGYYWLTYRSQGGFDHVTSIGESGGLTKLQGTRNTAAM